MFDFCAYKYFPALFNNIWLWVKSKPVSAFPQNFGALHKAELNSK